MKYTIEQVLAKLQVEEGAKLRLYTGRIGSGRSTIATVLANYLADKDLSVYFIGDGSYFNRLPKSEKFDHIIITKVDYLRSEDFIAIKQRLDNGDFDEVIFDCNLWTDSIDKFVQMVEANYNVHMFNALPKNGIITNDATYDDIILAEKEFIEDEGTKYYMTLIKSSDGNKELNKKRELEFPEVK